MGLKGPMTLSTKNYNNHVLIGFSVRIYYSFLCIYLQSIAMISFVQEFENQWLGIHFSLFRMDGIYMLLQIILCVKCIFTDFTFEVPFMLLIMNSLNVSPTVFFPFESLITNLALEWFDI